jgi:hypothetical protein
MSRAFGIKLLLAMTSNAASLFTSLLRCHHGTVQWREASFVSTKVAELQRINNVAKLAGFRMQVHDAAPCFVSEKGA